MPAPTDPPLGDAPTLAASASAPASLTTESDLVNPMLRVADAMTAAPRTCSPMSTVLEAVLIFRDADCGAVPITDAGKPVGVLTDRDVALALANGGDNFTRRPVGELMKQDVATINLDATLDEAMTRLGDSGVRRLLVVDDSGVLQGVLSWVDLVPHLSERGIGRVVSRIVENRA